MKQMSKSQIKKAKKLLKKLSYISQRNLEYQNKIFSKTMPIYDEAYFKALEYMENN